MTEVFDPDALMQIRDISWRAQTLLAATSSGVHRSLHHGASIEFSQYRDYTPGDDPRLIDWKLFGRTDRYGVKQFEDETARRVYLIVDQSRSMGYKTVSHSKLRYSQTLAATLALDLHRRRDRVGVLTFDESIETFVPPSRNSHQLARVFKVLSNEERGEATDIGGALQEVAELVPSRALVILFSDGLIPLDELAEPLALIAGREHEVLWIRAMDPREVHLDAPEGSQLRDRESGQLRFIDAASIEKYHRQFDAHALGLRNLCDDLGITLVSVRTDKPLVDQMIEIFEAASLRRSADLLSIDREAIK
ncbi:MAG: DUF58 domain-containing protein [Planctomycetota bacterium]